MISQKFIGVAVLLSALAGFVSAKSVGNDKELFWFPKDDGTGFVPAFLNSAARGLVAPLADPEDVNFLLHTHQNPDVWDEITTTVESIANSHWDVNAPVKFYAHGFGSGPDEGSGEHMKQGYIDNGYPENVNLVLVDWKELARAPFYDAAAENTELVGQLIANFVDFLVKNQLTTLSKVHLAGHSLGAHAVGFAGRFYREMNPGSSIARISGFDPALPWFGMVDDSERLDSTDADMVDVIHTASGKPWEGELAFMAPRGTVDFYPNKGRDQPGCGGLGDIMGACSHSRCYQYFSESIQHDNFDACKCNDDAWEDHDDFASCDCSKGHAKMGEWTTASARGIYYLQTNSESLFAI